MSKGDCLCNRDEPFAAFFWALGNVQVLDNTCRACWPSITPSPYTLGMFLHIWSMVIGASILNEDEPGPPSFFYLDMLFIYAVFAHTT